VRGQERQVAAGHVEVVHGHRMVGAQRVQRHLRHGLPSERLERFDLPRLERSGRLIEDAQRADRVAVGAQQRCAGVEANMGRSGDQRMIAEACIVADVGDHHDLVAQDGVRADGRVA
jgi:hypothetical protein